MANRVIDLTSGEAEEEDDPCRAGLRSTEFYGRQKCTWLESPALFYEWTQRVQQWKQDGTRHPRDHIDAAIESFLGSPGFPGLPDVTTTVRPIMDIYAVDDAPGQKEANRAARSIICNVHYTLQLMGLDTTELPNLMDVNALFAKMAAQRQTKNGEFRKHRDNTKPSPVASADLERTLGLTGESLDWYDQSFADMFTGSLSIPTNCLNQWSKMLIIVLKEISGGNSDLVKYLRAVGGKRFT